MKQAFLPINGAITKIALLALPEPSAFIPLMTVVSNPAFGAAFQLYTAVPWKPLAFFAGRLQQAEFRYSALGK